LKEEQFFKKFGESLDGLESILETQTSEQYVNIFVLGLPRSGTTLLTQLLYDNTNLQCTNNLMARFWETPLVGTQLSKYTVIKSEFKNYRSNYGRTLEIDHPHEFSKFWHKLLRITEIDKYEPDKLSDSIDWGKVRSKITNMNRILETGLVFKPMELIGFHLAKFVKLFKRSIIIFIERDPMDVALSILKARKDNHCTDDCWWGSYPPKSIYEKIKKKSEMLKVAHQILYFKKFYEDKVRLVPSNQFLKTSYTSVCNNPYELLKTIKVKAQKLGCDLQITKKPNALSIFKKTIDESTMENLLKAFDEAENDSSIHVQL